MKHIYDFQTNFVDFKYKLSISVFYNTCNIKPYCPFCYNKHIFQQEGNYDLNDLSLFYHSLMNELNNYKPGIVLSGGEPTFSPIFHQTIDLAEDIGAPLGIHTNGLITPMIGDPSVFDSVVVSLKPYSILLSSKEEYYDTLQRSLDFYSKSKYCELRVVNIPQYKEEYEDAIWSLDIPSSFNLEYVKPLYL